MESKLGMESGWHELGVRMNQSDGRDIREAAQVSRDLMNAGLGRAAWYCCLLVRLGELLISFGNHLRVRYSVRSMTRTS